MPKITLITLDYPPQRGGVARYLSELVRASEGKMNVIMPPIEKRRWWQLVATCFALRGASATVLVSHVFPVGTAAWISRMFGGPEYIVLFHGLDIRQARTPFKRWLLKKIVASAKGTVANSVSTSKDLRQIVAVHPLILTPGVESVDHPSKREARRRLGIDQDVPLVVSVARLVPRKGIDVAIKAIAELQQGKDIVYAVIGDGADRERLRVIAQEARAKVTWVRDAEDAEKWLWLAAADVFVLPVRDEGDDVEGFGIVFLEAALVGIPSIAGNSGGAREAVLDGETGFLVDPASVPDLVALLQKLIGYEEYCEQLGKRAKRRAETEFRWKDRWDKLEQALT